MAARDFHDNLATARKRKKLTVEACANRSGVSVPSWYRYESGHQFPATPEVFDAVAGVVGLKSASLFANRRPKKKSS